MALETGGDNCLQRTAETKSYPQAFSNSELLSHDSWQSGAEDYGKHFQAAHDIRTSWIGFRAWWLWAPVLFFSWLGKKSKVSKVKRVFILGNNGPKSSHYEGNEIIFGEFQRVAKSYPKVFCFPFWSLANFGCPLVRDGQPDYLQIRGGRETLLVVVNVFWRFLLTWKVRFHPIWRFFHEKYGPNWPYFEGKNPCCQSS